MICADCEQPWPVQCTCPDGPNKAPIVEAVEAFMINADGAPAYTPKEAIRMAMGSMLLAASSYRSMEHHWDHGDPYRAGRALGRYMKAALRAQEWIEKSGMAIRLRRDLLSDNAYGRWEGYLGVMHNGPTGPYECFNHPPFTVNADSDEYHDDDTSVAVAILAPPWDPDTGMR